MIEQTTLVLIGLHLLLAGSCFYLILCADPNSSGILGIIHRFIFKFFPQKIKSTSKKTDGDEKPVKKNALVSLADSFFNYLCNTNHRIIQGFYVLVAFGGYLLYLVYGFNKHFPNSQVSSWMSYLGSAMAFFCFYTYYLVCAQEPGQITSQNVKQYVKKYEEYTDGILYEKANKCSTCNLIKPARSKHCKVCNMCVSRFDHHCIWVRQCVGEKNYKYFLLFIGSHAILTLYGAIIGVKCVYGIILDSNLLNAKFRITGTDEITEATWTIIIKFLFYKETMFIFIIVLCAIMGIALLLFILYHLNLTSANMTTNERIKRSDYMHFIGKEIQKIEGQYKNDQQQQSQQPEAAANLQKKLDQYKRDFAQLDKWFPNSGLKHNLKKIFAS